MRKTGPNQDRTDFDVCPICHLEIDLQLPHDFDRNLQRPVHRGCKQGGKMSNDVCPKTLCAANRPGYHGNCKRWSPPTHQNIDWHHCQDYCDYVANQKPEGRKPRQLPLPRAPWGQGCVIEKISGKAYAGIN